MTTPSSNTQLEAWERHEGPVMAVVPYGMLAISVVLTVIIEGWAGTSLLITLALSGLTAAWMLWMVTLHPAWTKRLVPMVIYFVGLVALMAVLVLRAPWFGIFAWAGYLQVVHLPRGRWTVVGVISVAVVLGTSQNGGLPSPEPASVSTYIIFILVNVVVAGALIWFGLISGEQNDRRKQALAELAEANSRLETMLEENAGLHAQLLTQAREAGVFDERQRMAREIHDTLAQGFAGIIAQLEAAKRSDPHSDQWQLHVDQAQTLARESLTEARRSVQALRPESLENSRLPEAIANMARRWSEISGVPASFETTGEVRQMPAEVEVTLFRIAQEALTNVAKHAQASRVGLTLSYMEDVVLLDVRDDGVGFAVRSMNSNGQSSDGHGFGLSAMKQRLRQVSGNLEIESAPGEGTSINARVPTIQAGDGA